jgi:hypothetical protein
MNAEYPRASAVAHPLTHPSTSRGEGQGEVLVETETVGELSLKGFSRPIAVYNIIGLRETLSHESHASPPR